ncbi:LuxQ periplasmic sensor domain-containing protein [Vibrio maerlii]|uniref:LuxQ periplasmic sensor domain-containing protein n=1 Tax=Vibrio maerlii TaxID=2231648 RepID=UPI0013E0C7EB|nr:LuxQ periplasmic sensor domain-containing protein [Vibrio maerlii]
MGFSLVIAMLQHYRFSSSIINEEINSNLQRVSSLIQNQFDYHLNIRQIQQDRNANSTTVADLYNKRDLSGLDYYFLGLDEATPQNTPDIRFIFDDNGLFWDDGNAQFYGLSSQDLEALAVKVAFSADWYSSSVDGALGKRHVLMRRAPMIEQDTGRVLSQLYIIQILDNSFSLVESLQNASDTLDVLLSVNSTPVADTLSREIDYQVSDLLLTTQGTTMGGQYITSYTRLNIDGEPSPLLVISVLNNSSINELRTSQLRNLASMLVLLVILSLIGKAYFDRQVAKELTNLMEFTKNAGHHETAPVYSGSKIKEFHHIGYTLENTFEQLMERERSFQDLFNFSPSLVIIWDSNLHVLQINPAAREVLDHQGPSSQFSQFLLDIGGYLSTSLDGKPQTEVYVPVGERVFRWTISPIQLENGVHTIITQGSDVTSLIEAEKQSERARIEAESAAHARADFLARMSHEIRTPLNGILGISQLLKESISTPEQKKQVEVLHNSGEHLLEVLNDVLDFSKIEQGKFEIILQEFKYADLVKPVFNIFQTLCLTKGVDFELATDVEEELLLISDQTRLKQIILNLVSNAVKFTHQGKVTVAIHWHDRQRKQLNIDVTDTGIGIEKSRLKNMFEPFVQAEPTITREYGGSGLGLTIVKNLVDMLGGDINVKSSVGEGSVFSVQVPVKVASVFEEAQEDEAFPIDYGLFGKPLNILLVEDNHTNAFIAQAFCKKYQMDVVWAKDGQEALELVAEQPFDLILMDNQLPTISGIDTTEKIRNQLKLTTPIYACTADGLSETRQAFFNAGANLVLVKPLQEITLYNAFVALKNDLALT